jgi:hypothetical protein
MRGWIRQSSWIKVFVGALAGVLVGTLVVTQFVDAQDGTTVATCVDSTGSISVLSDPTGYVNRSQSCNATEAHPLDLDTPAQPAQPAQPAPPARLVQRVRPDRPVHPG